MATYTSNYGLHQWAPEDNFLRTDFNEDLKKIDTALGGKADGTETQAALDKKSEVVTGNYTGNGGSQTINLGFRPAAVLISLGYQNYFEARFAMDGDISYITMTNTGFRLQYEQNSRVNNQGRSYLFLAFCK